MFVEMFTKNEIIFAQDDYKILDDVCIGTYNTKAIEERMKEFLMNIKEMECKYFAFIIRNLTQKYELKEEMFTGNRSNPTEKTALERIQTKEDIEEAFDSFRLIYNNLFSYYEKMVFVEMILLNRSRDSMKDILNVGQEKIYQIKKSVLVKLAIGLNWENIKN